MSELGAYLYGMGRFAAVQVSVAHSALRAVFSSVKQSLRVAWRAIFPLQVVFWGNPTTPGHIDSVDYFMSGDVMEIDKGQTHYTEQLIRLDGQGIW